MFTTIPWKTCELDVQNHFLKWILTIFDSLIAYQLLFHLEMVIFPSLYILCSFNYKTLSTTKWIIFFTSELVISHRKVNYVHKIKWLQVLPCCFILDYKIQYFYVWLPAPKKSSPDLRRSFCGGLKLIMPQNSKIWPFSG